MVLLKIATVLAVASRYSSLTSFRAVNNTDFKSQNVLVVYVKEDVKLSTIFNDKEFTMT